MNLDLLRQFDIAGLAGRFSSIIAIVLIGVLTHLALVRLLAAAIRRGVALQSNRRHQELSVDAKYRIRTLRVLIRRTSRLLTIGVVLLMVLAQLGINIAPVLTGAGVAGIAIGFGAQTLVKDVISGLFILLEDQFSIGEYVEIAGIKGEVTDMNLRRTVLRDDHGVQHTVPNSAITVSANYTKKYSTVNVNIPLPYNVNLERALKVVRDTVSQFARRQTVKDVLVDDGIVVEGVVDYTTNGMIVRVQARVKPNQQWAIEHDLREKLQIAFKKARIELGAARLTI